MNNKEVIHPIFLDFAQHAKDDYWKLLYEDMAFGKFPTGVYIQKEHFCCFHKGKEFSIQLENNFTVFTQVHSLLSINLGISSEKEKQQFKEDVLCTQSLKDPKRLVKDSTLTSFVLREGEKHHIPDMILRRIFSLLVIGFMFKTLLIKDVIFEGPVIKSIKGFNFSNKKIRITKNVFDVKTTISLDEPRNDNNLLSSSWSKYLHSLDVMSACNSMATGY